MPPKRICQNLEFNDAYPHFNEFNQMHALTGLRFVPLLIKNIKSEKHKINFNITLHLIIFHEL